MVKKLLKAQKKREDEERAERERKEKEAKQSKNLERILGELGAKANRAESDAGSMRSGNSSVHRRASQMSHHSKIRMQDTVLDHSKAISKAKHQITRICLTGGPCAGKTTALTTMCERLSSYGFKVLLVPEAATLMMKGGCFIQTKKMTFADGVQF